MKALQKKKNKSFLKLPKNKETPQINEHSKGAVSEYAHPLFYLPKIIA